MRRLSSKQKRLHKRRKLAKRKVERTKIQPAICRGDKVIEYNWPVLWDKEALPQSHHIKLPMYSPDTTIGVIIHGTIKPSRTKQGRVFVDLCNGRCWYLVNAEGGGLALDHKTHVRVDGDVVKLAIKRYEDHIARML